jgi:hypothetical protein
VSVQTTRICALLYVCGTVSLCVCAHVSLYCCMQYPNSSTRQAACV